MGVTNILQRRVKPIKYASDDEEANSILLETEAQPQSESENPESQQQHQPPKTKEDRATYQTVRKSSF
jgi:hypothetical protein